MINKKDMVEAIEISRNGWIKALKETPKAQKTICDLIEVFINELEVIKEGIENINE